MNENQVEPNDLPPWNGARFEALFVYRRTNVSIEGSRLFFDERERQLFAIFRQKAGEGVSRELPALDKDQDPDKKIVEDDVLQLRELDWSQGWEKMLSLLCQQPYPRPRVRPGRTTLYFSPTPTPVPDIIHRYTQDGQSSTFTYLAQKHGF
jgi:hypothetical protein